MNQDKLLNNVIRDIELLDDSAKLQVAEMVLRSLRGKISNEPNEKAVRFVDLQGIGCGVWNKDGSIDDFIREERESWRS